MSKVIPKCKTHSTNSEEGLAELASIFRFNSFDAKYDTIDFGTIVSLEVY